MFAGTKAISALSEAVLVKIDIRFALKLNDNRRAEKSLMHCPEIVGIPSFQRDFIRERKPDLRDHANRVLLGVVAQLGANMKKSLSHHIHIRRVSLSTDCAD